MDYIIIIAVALISIVVCVLLYKWQSRETNYKAKEKYYYMGSYDEWRAECCNGTIEEWVLTWMRKHANRDALPSDIVLLKGQHYEYKLCQQGNKTIDVYRKRRNR